MGLIDTYTQDYSSKIHCPHILMIKDFTHKIQCSYEIPTFTVTWYLLLKFIILIVILFFKVELLTTVDHISI